MIEIKESKFIVITYQKIVALFGNFGKKSSQMVNMLLVITIILLKSTLLC